MGLVLPNELVDVYPQVQHVQAAQTETRGGPLPLACHVLVPARWPLGKEMAAEKQGGGSEEWSRCYFVA